jgi:two-component system response regulator
MGERSADRTILLVEDDPDDEALTLRSLRKHAAGTTITVARDGAEALDHLFPGCADTALPGLVLLDLNLPRVDGLEVLRGIRGHDRTCFVPVVILTSSKEEEDIIASYRGGANAYVRKPVKFSSFVEAAKALGTFWLIFNEGPADPPPARD